MRRPRKTCCLCADGVAKHGGNKHGVRLKGVGMVDTSCPITRAEYDALVTQIALTLSAKGPAQ